MHRMDSCKVRRGSKNGGTKVKRSNASMAQSTQNSTGKSNFYFKILSLDGIALKISCSCNFSTPVMPNVKGINLVGKCAKQSQSDT